MTFRKAKMLKRYDRVIDKSDLQVMVVRKIKIVQLKRPTVFIEAENFIGRWQEYMHTEVK
jgi:hypothetical protein